MNKNPADYTPEETKWVAMKQAKARHQYHKCYGFDNMALTEAGELVIGLTKHKNGYSSLYLERDGERTFGSSEWDLAGKALENHADLRLATVQSNVRRI